MYYNFSLGAKHNKGIFSTGVILCLAGAIIAVGSYVVMNRTSPLIFAKTNSTKQNIESIVKTKQPSDNDRIFIPSIGVDAPIRDRYSGNGVLRKGALLSAKKFSIGLTPSETMRQSPLYHLADMRSGDRVFIDMNGERLVYEAVNISNSNVAKITTLQNGIVIYSYEDSGAATLVTLKLVGTMQWLDGQASIVGRD